MNTYLGWCAFGVLFSVAALAEPNQRSAEPASDPLGMVGTVHFAVSCSAPAQKTFASGVAMLHSFWYEESEKAFEQAAQEDPRCGMAHWGLAMNLWHPLWSQPNAATLKRGLAEAEQAEALHPKSPRERAYIAAIKVFYSDYAKRSHEARASAYSQAMEKLYRDYPQDHEAAAFYALSLLASERDDDTAYTNRKKAAAILEKLFAEEPDHPGAAHYLIHAYDIPSMARLGLPAAQRYAKIAPTAPHALHMPSHIFARLGMWQEDIASNRASIAASRRAIALHMGGGSHQFHAMRFLFYAYLQCRQETQARQLLAELKAMPPMKGLHGGGMDQRLPDLTLFEALYPLELHRWAEAAALTPVAEAEPGYNARIYWARAIGKARTGDLAGARQDLAELASIHQGLLAQKRTGFAEAVAQNMRQAQAWIYHAEGKHDAALALLRGLAQQEETAIDPDLGLTAREMLADMLLELQRPQEALENYERDLKFNPNRYDALYGAARAAELAGKREQAKAYRAQLAQACASSGSGSGSAE